MNESQTFEELWSTITALYETGKRPAIEKLIKLVTLSAGLYKDQGQFNKAESLCRRALAINEQALGPHHLNNATSLDNLAGIYRNQGKYCQAEPLLRRALAIKEEALGPQHPSTIKSLNNLADLYWCQELFSEAELLLRRLLAIREQALGPDHPDTATSLNNLAVLHLNLGQHGLVEQLLCRALAIREEVLGKEHIETAITMDNLGSLYKTVGEFGKAVDLQRKALSSFEKSLGPEHPTTSTCSRNLSLLYMELGLYEHAANLMSRDMDICVKALGPEHLETATSLSNLAFLCKVIGMYEEAEPLYCRALAILEKTLGPNSKITAICLNNLANLYKAKGQYCQAEALLKRALANLEQAVGCDHPDTAKILLSMADLFGEQLQHGQAELLCTRALAIFQAVFVDDHPITSLSLHHLSKHCLLQEQFDQTEKYLKRALKIDSSFVRREAMLLPQAQRMLLRRVQGAATSNVFALASLHSPSAELALWTRLNFHGLLQEIEQRQMRLRQLSGPHQEIAERLTSLERRLASSTVPPVHRKQLQNERDDLEREYLRVAPDLFIDPVEIDDMAHALPANAMLIEFQRFFTPEAKGSWGETRYLALLLTAGGTVAQVDLGAAHLLEALIAKAMAATTEGLADAAEYWMELSHAFLPPLLCFFGTATRCFLSLDGELHRLPFNALPMPGQPRQLFADWIEINILSTGRDLLRPEQIAATTLLRPLVLANPNYDLNLENKSSKHDGEASAQRRRSRELGTSQSWEPLPGTDQEGKQVAFLLDADLFTEADATTRALQQAANPVVLHVATHGFFLPDQESEEPRQPFNPFEDGDLLAHFRGEDPMLRSGLVLTGANHPEADPEDDGYLTALEATLLNLRGTELVTLSACDSGRGHICTGEGVYGLQRALIVAGARSTLLSLWKVPDDATCVFMVRFYSLLKEGEGRANALRQVQREFRNHTNIVWQHPYYWAAWQLVGDSGPIEGL